MLINIDNEVVALFVELRDGLHKAVENGDTDKANRFDRQLSNLAINEINKGVSRAERAH